MKNKTNISVKDNLGARVTSDMIVGTDGPYVSGDILDANATLQLINGTTPGNVSFASLTGEPMENTALASVLNTKVTKSVNDLVNYYLKSETYTKAEVAALIGSIQQFHYEIYNSTSSIIDPADNILYLIGPTGSGSDRYEEYVYANNSFVKIGDTSIDLSQYSTTAQMNTAINNALTAYVTSTSVKTIWVGTQAQYDAITVKDPNTEYNIIEA